MTQKLILTTMLSLISLLLLPTAAADDFSYPPEWEKQESVWLGWMAPSEQPNSPGGQLEAAQNQVRVQLISEMLSGSRVTLLVSKAADEAHARQMLVEAKLPLERIDFFYAPVSDPFVRDAGPRFASNGKKLGVLDIPWTCYGYDPQVIGAYLAECLAREDTANRYAQERSLSMVKGRAVSEGGALDATDTLLMGYLDTAMQRNPGMTQAEIEADYLATYGKQKMIWLSRSPVSDRPGQKAGKVFGWGANGHVDEYARFVNETTVVIAQVGDVPENDPLAAKDAEILRSNLADLRAARTVDDQPLNVITMPAANPVMFGYQAPLGMPSIPPGWATLAGLEPSEMVTHVPAVSYMNFVITNDKVIVPAYWQDGLPESVRADDQRAGEVLAELFPDRKLVRINPLPINWWGGGMHCMTQQQPALGDAESATSGQGHTG